MDFTTQVGPVAEAVKAQRMGVYVHTAAQCNPWFLIFAHSLEDLVT